jgi:hypothetical protein
MYLYSAFQQFDGDEVGSLAGVVQDQAVGLERSELEPENKIYTYVSPRVKNYPKTFLLSVIFKKTAKSRLTISQRGKNSLA